MADGNDFQMYDETAILERPIQESVIYHICKIYPVLPLLLFKILLSVLFFTLN